MKLPIATELWGYRMTSCSSEVTLTMPCPSRSRTAGYKDKINSVRNHIIFPAYKPINRYASIVLNTIKAFIT